jgi:isopenicillin-N epimerase
MIMFNTRRSFLGGVTGVVVGGLTYPGSAAASTKKLGMLMAGVAPGSDSYWKVVAEQFPVRQGKIMLNAANLCPSPRTVSEQVAQLTRDEDSDVSFPNRAKFDDLLQTSRTKVAAQLNVSADEIALVRNTSEANNTVNAGVSLKAGDEVVLWEQNHPCNNVAWEVRAARYGFSIKRVKVPMTAKSADEVVKLFEAAMTPQTKVLSITYVSNSSGFRLPAKQIFAMARQRNADIYCHLDGAQTWGFLKLDLKDIGCDSFAASAHKWFMGPKQAGLLYVRQASIARLWPSIVSVGWGNAAETSAKGARKFEAFGQRDDAGLAAVGTAADFHSMIGLENVEARTTELATSLKEGLSKINRVKLVTPMDPKMSGGIAISELVGMDRKQTAAFVNDLYVKYGIAGAPTGGVRLCPHTYNTRDDVDRTIYAVRQLLG